MTSSPVADLAALLAEPSGTAEIALERRLAGLEFSPPLADVVELGARARAMGASREEVLLALHTLLALHAPPARAPGATP